MKLPQLTLNQKLAALAFVLGAVALFAQPHRGPFVKLDGRELALVVEQEVDHVTAPELAAWIVEGRADYRLIDLRSAAEYAAYHIPTAENVPLSDLVDYPLLRTEKVVLYSEGGIHSAQAWMLLRAQGHESAYMVLGGLDAWKDEVLYPALPADAGPQQRAKIRAGRGAGTVLRRATACRWRSRSDGRTGRPAQADRAAADPGPRHAGRQAEEKRRLLSPVTAPGHQALGRRRRRARLPGRWWD